MDPLPTLQCLENQHGGGSVMVWTAMLDGRSPLHVFDRGSVTGVRYRDEVLELYAFSGVQWTLSSS